MRCAAPAVVHACARQMAGHTEWPAAPARLTVRVAVGLPVGGRLNPVLPPAVADVVVGAGAGQQRGQGGEEQEAAHRRVGWAAAGMGVGG